MINNKQLFILDIFSIFIQPQLFTKVFFCRLCFLKMPNVELRLLGAVASHRSGYTLCVFLFPRWNLLKQANGSVPLPMVLKHYFQHLKVTSLSTRLSGYVFHILKSGAVVLWLDFLSPLCTKCAALAICQVIGCGARRFFKLPIIMYIKVTEVL